ncbi:MAG: hypothetical protein EZS28_009723, partial [Streblomastix strix]
MQLPPYSTMQETMRNTANSQFFIDIFAFLKKISQGSKNKKQNTLYCLSMQKFDACALQLNICQRLSQISVANVPHYFENIKSSRIQRFQTVSSEQHLLVQLTIMFSDYGRFVMTFKLSDYCLVGQDAEFKPLQFHFFLNKDNLPLETVIIPFFDADSLYIMNSASICSYSLHQCRNREFDATNNLEVDQGNPLSEQFECIYNPSLVDVTATKTTVQGESYSGAQRLSIDVNIGTNEYIVDTCTFTDCVNAGNGGAIDIRLTTGGKASFINSQFTGCQANTYGGAIYAWIQSGGILTIDGQCKFTECTSQVYGGGISAEIEGENSKLIIGNGAIFDTCSCQRGGGLYANIRTGAYLIFEGDCQFQNCSVNSGSGGGIYASVTNEGSQIRCLGELMFVNCSSSFIGGGAFIGSVDKASIELNKVTCVDCKSGQGAGLNIQPDSNTHFSISGKASFTRCESTGSGGGICFSIQGNTEIQLTGEMEFIDCIGQRGGGISIGSIYKLILVISNTCIFKNCTGSQGGGMYMPLSDIETDIQITGELSFDNCSCTDQGGGIYLSTSRSQLSFGNMLVFKDCSSTYGGGLYVSCSNEGMIQFIEELNFENCSSNQQGGAIYANIQSGGIFTIDGQCKFTECTTQNNGGGIFAQIDGQNTTLVIGNGLIFDTCSCYGYGGGVNALIISSAQLIIQGDCQFINCSTSGSIGGGMSATVTNEGSLIQCLGELLFNNCSSSSVGGGASLISGDKASTEINKVTCVDCKSRLGAGLNVQPSSNAYFTISGQASFTRCESTGFGGGICFIAGDNTEIRITGKMKFIDCIGEFGGGFSIGTSNKIILVISNECIFQNCTGLLGGGLDIQFSHIDTYMQITGELSFDNCSSSQGGALRIVIRGSQLIFEKKIHFKDCQCPQIGGGLYVSCSYEGTIHFIDELKFENCSAGTGGGGLYIQCSDQGIIQFIEELNFDNCSANYYGGGIYLQCSGAESNIQISGDLLFDNCKVEIAGGGLYMSISFGGSVTLDNKCEFLKCKSGNGGAMYLNINFELQSSFQIKDILIQECQALINTESTIYSQSGFGGGIFITGTGDYDVSSKMLDFRKMKMYGNSADKAGQSLYVAMPNVIQWCRIGNAGEYVKGNYSDITSDESELEGIPVGYSNFNGLSQVDIMKDQRPLELWWRTIWHILNRNDGIIKGLDQIRCSEYNNPCCSINYALQEISVELGGTTSSIIPEKRIGICEAGYDLTSPILLSKNSTYTNIIKIMKQLYLTKYNMEGKAEIKIIKGGDASNIENGHKGWISASGGIELKFYFIKLVTDKSKFNIPIIYI